MARRFVAFHSTPSQRLDFAANSIAKLVNIASIFNFDGWVFYLHTQADGKKGGSDYVPPSGPYDGADSRILGVLLGLLPLSE